MRRRRFLIGGSGVAIAGVGSTVAGVRRMGSMKEYNASVAATRAALAQSPAFVDLLRFATLAANGHNTQPWRFRIGQYRIEILPDLARRTPVTPLVPGEYSGVFQSQRRSRSRSGPSRYSTVAANTQAKR